MATPALEAWGVQSPAWEYKFIPLMAEVQAYVTMRRSFRTAELIGKCPSIMKYAASTQREILCVVLRDMQPWGVTRLSRTEWGYK